MNLASSELVMAAQNGDLPRVLAVLSDGSEKEERQEALLTAAKAGCLDVVNALIPVTDPKFLDSLALFFAAANGHLNVVESLAPLSDPKSAYSRSLMFAAANDHLAVVKHLIPLSHPLEQDSRALQLAVENGHKEVMVALIPCSDLNAVAQTLADGHQLKILDQLAVVLSQVGGHEGLVDEWMAQFGKDNFCMTTGYQLAVVREEQAGTVKGAPKGRAVRPRC